VIRYSFFGLLPIGACLVVTIFSCQPKQEAKTIFNKVSHTITGISFENSLINTDDFNIIEYLYFYNGGGVAIGDINNDSLPDIYFTSNQNANALYLNKGNLSFEDITSKAGVSGAGNWKTGVTMADVNGDGYLDIFVCGVGNYKKFTGRNQLLLNNGDLTFTDKTEEYGLSFLGFSTQASFFDYDNDGDLDMYLVNHSVHTRRSYGDASLRFEHDSLAGDKLYQNTLVPHGKPFFKEVTSAAGILNSHIGYGLSVGISDLNMDGFLDIYVSNDFGENDYLYVNQGNGTFKQELEKSIPHSSRFSMGNDIADINNDGLNDIVTLDMLPRDEEVIKTSAGEDAFEIYEFKLRYGYHYQFARNALQLNRGTDKNGSLMFSDIAPLAGVEATDWSWGPLLADFDNDGLKDLFISNGIVGRPNDLDYFNYIRTDSAQHYYPDQQLIDQMPSGKVSNFVFRNNGDLTFRDVSDSWLGRESSLSNGASYSDLDNDGDLDLVVNNINEKASIYRNDLPAEGSKFLKVRLDGAGSNRFGIGSKIVVYAGGKKMYYEQIPTRGWLSSVDFVIHIGLGNVTAIDSVYVRWPAGNEQTLRAITTNQTLVVKERDSRVRSSNEIQLEPEDSGLLLEAEQSIPFKHKENDFVAFSTERLIPHMISTQGPKLSVGDVNGDSLDDFFIGGAAGQASSIFIQDHSGTFSQSSQPAIEADSLAEDVSAAFFDADANGTLDLIVVSGGQQFSGNHKNLKPRLYLNDGSGIFKKDLKQLPAIFLNASCVKPADVDNDGDTDLFIGGRVVTGKYGVDPPSYLLINNGRGEFEDASARLFSTPQKGSFGMVTDAVWCDVNRDKRFDLVVVGEWMPVTVMIQNEKGGFDNRTIEYGLSKTNGWWNTITADDFDKDGDIDFVAGNLGLNSRLRASDDEPVSMYTGDIDSNNSLDHILTYYNQGKSHPLLSRDQLVKQVPALRRRFLKYENYKNVQLDEIIEPEMRKRFSKKDVFTFGSAYIENLGNGKLVVNELPIEAQTFPIFSFCIDDINNDGNTDIVAVGNIDAVQPDFGRYDAGYGLVLLGNGKGRFESIRSQRSGLVVKGQGRDVKTVVTSTKEKLFLISRNNDTIMVFKKADQSKE